MIFWMMMIGPDSKAIPQGRNRPTAANPRQRFVVPTERRCWITEQKSLWKV
jgi:hypothetical protein